MLEVLKERTYRVSHWNYRFCVETVPDGIGGTEDVWTVREVYYDDEGKVNGFSADPMHAQSESCTGLADELLRMTNGFQLPNYRIEGNELTEIGRVERLRTGKRGPTA